MGSLQDRIVLAAFYKHEQREIFQSMVTIYSNAISVNPEIAKKIERIVDDYIDLIVPGSKSYRKASEDAFIKKQSAALEDIFNKVKTHYTK